MEEASGVDLDWFWRGWFYSTDHVDISLDKIYQLRIDTKNPDIDYGRLREFEKNKPMSLFVKRNREEVGHCGLTRIKISRFLRPKRPIYGDQ